MTKKRRYVLLSFCLLGFLIIAPLMALYVGGITYNFKTHSFEKTGILGVRVQPTDVQIFLNDKLTRTSQGDIKFLPPGEYQIDIKKQGYQDWSKRLEVSDGQVTWANPSFGSIYLFLNSPPVTNINEGILDFYEQNNILVQLDGSNVIVQDNNNLSKKNTYPLPKPATRILLADTAGKNFVLGDASATPTLLLFNSVTGKISDFSQLFAQSPSLQFDDAGNLYALSAGVVYKIDAAADIKTQIFSGVKAFFPQGNSLYLIEQNQNTSQLSVSQAPFGQSQNLISNLPAFSSGQLWVTYEKEIFLLADGALYKLSSGTQPLATGVSEFDINPSDSSFTILHSGELDYYDPVARGLNFVTRSSEVLQNPNVNAATASAFFLKNNQLYNIELDSRDQQNQYLLYQGQQIQKFFLDDAAKTAWILDNGELKMLQLR